MSFALARRIAIVVTVAVLLTTASAFAKKKDKDNASATPPSATNPPASNTPGSSSTPTTNPSGANKSEELQKLTQAYLELEKADHDYDGHRVAAMHAISEAGKVLGTEIQGRGPGHEKQVVSDDQLKLARQILQGITPTGKGKKHKEVMKHIKHALSEIDTALGIK